MEDSGGTGAEEPPRVGQAGGGRRASAVAGMLPCLERMCARATGAIAVVVEPLGGGGRKCRHHTAGGIVHLHAFRLEDHPPGWRPGPGAIDQLLLETATGRRRLAMGVGQSAPWVLATPRLLERGRGLTEQDGMARQANNHSRPAVRGDPSAALRGGTLTSATAQHMGVGPVAPAVRPQPDHAQGLVGPRRARARTEDGRDPGLRRPFDKEERQRAMGLRGMLIERALLLAIRRISRVGQRQDQSGGGRRRAGDAVVQQGACESREGLAVDWGLETREGRGAGSVVGWVPGTPLHAECDHGGMAQVMGVRRVRRA